MVTFEIRLYTLGNVYIEKDLRFIMCYQVDNRDSKSILFVSEIFNNPYICFDDCSPNSIEWFTAKYSFSIFQSTGVIILFFFFEKKKNLSHLCYTWQWMFTNIFFHYNVWYYLFYRFLKKSSRKSYCYIMKSLN